MTQSMFNDVARAEKGGGGTNFFEEKWKAKKKKRSQRCKRASKAIVDRDRALKYNTVIIKLLCYV